MIGALGAESFAISAPLPVYPAEAIKQKKEGLAVASVVVDSDGHITRSALEQIPDPLLARSVEDAVRGTVFRKLIIDGSPATGRGKLFYYFRIENGHGLVETPRQIFSRRQAWEP